MLLIVSKYKFHVLHGSSGTVHDSMLIDLVLHGWLSSTLVGMFHNKFD